MNRAAETQNEIIERWKAELARITNLGYHPEPDGSQRECIHLDNVLVRLSLIVGEAFTMGMAQGLEVAKLPRYIVLGAHSQAEADFTAASGFNYDPASINEAFSDLPVYDPYKSHRHVAETLGPSPLGDLRDPRGPLPKVEVKAHGSVWPEPATGGPASIPLAGERQGCGAAGSGHLGACRDCFCLDSSHGGDGCQAIGCDCPNTAKDVARFAAEDPGTGEQP